MLRRKFRHKLPRKAALSICLLAFTLLIVAAARAQAPERCHIAAEQRIRGNFIAFCETLRLDGRVDGALIVAAVEAEIRGSVGGDAYILAARLDLYGELAKDLHFAGGALEIHEGARFSAADGKGALLAATLHSGLAEGARLPGDFLGVGYQLTLAGELGGSLEYRGSRLSLAPGARVAGAVRATVGDAEQSGISQLQPLLNLLPLPLAVELLPPGLTMAEGARVAGDLRYQAARPAEIAGQVGGEVVHEETPASAPGVSVRPADWQRYWRNALREIVLLAIITTGAHLLAGRPLYEARRQLSLRPLPSFGVGLLSFILSFPIFLLLALASGLLLLPLNWLGTDLLLYGGLLAGMVEFGLMSLFYFGAIFLSRVVAAVALGRILRRRLARWRGGERDGAATGADYRSALLGCVALALLSSLPFVGWVLNAFAAFIGLGAIVLSLRQRLRVLKLPAPAPARLEERPPIPGEDEAPPPPPLAATGWRAQPGMLNLPPGFRWWGDEDEPEREGDDG